MLLGADIGGSKDWSMEVVSSTISYGGGGDESVTSSIIMVRLFKTNTFLTNECRSVCLR